jgi:hypothetical protein
MSRLYRAPKDYRILTRREHNGSVVKETLGANCQKLGRTLVYASTSLRGSISRLNRVQISERVSGVLVDRIREM